MKQYSKNLNKTIAVGIIALGLVAPLLIFLNRVLIPDVSFDSLNYHLYLGSKGWHLFNNIFEFFPTGIHNFPSILDMPGYAFFTVLGYRMGTVFSLLAIYTAIWGLYKIYRLVSEKKEIGIVGAFLLVSSFWSFELFLGLGTYYIDGLVAAITVWSIYWLLKYFKEKKEKDLIISVILIILLVYGKLTNIYIAAAYIIVLIGWWLINKRNLEIKYGKFIGVILVGLVLPASWYGINWKTTGNPVFPFYNNVFKSEYFPKINFVESRFGGRNIGEKLTWVMSSFNNPQRLGEVHDLYNDFKLNIYVFLIVALWIASNLGKEKNSLFDWLTLIFILGVLGWELTFGYLRYGLVLELMGGLLVLLNYEKLGKAKIFLIPVLVWLVIVNKRIINMNLAYDLSFRPGYFYNRISYPKEINNLNKNTIFAESKENPDIYLNCSAGSMTYYVLSPFNKLPVLNIDIKAYGEMTNNINYQRKSWEKLASYLGDKKNISFVTITAKKGLNENYNDCINNLKKKGFKVTGEIDSDFLGYKNHEVTAIFGMIER